MAHLFYYGRASRCLQDDVYNILMDWWKQGNKVSLTRIELKKRLNDNSVNNDQITNAITKLCDKKLLKILSGSRNLVPIVYPKHEVEVYGYFGNGIELKLPRIISTIPLQENLHADSHSAYRVLSSDLVREGFLKGDYIIVNKVANYVSGDIIFFMDKNRRAFLKRITIQGDGSKIMSPIHDFSGFSPFVCNDFFYMGKLAYMTRSFK